MIARIAYKDQLEAVRAQEKQKLSNMLSDLQTQLKTTFNIVDYEMDKAASKIQNAARKMLARKRFRLSLYKLMLFKNLVENKVHKEKMQMLYAFEQMIINTEDQDDQEYYDELYGHEKKSAEDEDDYYDDEAADGGDSDSSAMAALQYYQRHKQFPPM